ncbi:MAG: hypothetical protein ABJO86_00670 [Lentilitoribacter sp.]
MTKPKDTVDAKSSENEKKVDPIATLYGEKPTAEQTKSARSQLNEMAKLQPWEQLPSPVKQAIRDDIAKQPAGDHIYKLGYSNSIVSRVLNDLGSA